MMSRNIETMPAHGEALELSLIELDDVAGGLNVAEVAHLAGLAASLAAGGKITSHATELK